MCTRPARTTLVLAGLVILGSAALALARHYEARRSFQIARKALERDDLELADHHLRGCLQVLEDQADVYLLAAETARRRDNFDDADTYLTAAERLAPVSQASELQRSLLIAQVGEPDSVRKQLEAIAKQRPDQAAPILEALGKGYVNSFVKADALRCFNTLLKLQPNHSRALYWRGKTYESLDRLDLALADYRQAVELAPSPDETRLALARTLYRLGNSWEAIPHYECLLQRKSEAVEILGAEILLGLARCRIDLYERDDASRLLKKLLAEHPNHADALLELGRLEFHAGRPAEAENWLRRAAGTSPDDHDTQRSLLLCLQAQGKDAEAQRSLEQLDAIDAKLRALHALTEKTRDGRRDAPLRWEIGEHLRRLGRMDDAVSYWYAALGDDPQFGPAHASLADHWRQSGQMYRSARHRLKAIK